MTFRITRVRWRDEKVVASTDAAKEKAYWEAGDEVAAEANKIVPHREGILTGSSNVDADQDHAVISYDTPYAARLHENPQYHFQKGRQGRWLETTINGAGNMVLRIFEKHLGRSLR